MSDVMIPSDNDRFAAAESVQDYIIYLEDTLDATEAENKKLKSHVKELYKALDDDDDSGMLGISGV